MIRLVLYDLDGTLVDTKKDLTQAANHMLSEAGLPPRSADEIGRYVGRGLRHLVQGCFRTEDPVRVEKGVAVFLEYYAHHLMDHSTLYPGAAEILDYFSRRTQAVLTNKPDPHAKNLLDGLEVGNYFAEIVAGNSGYPKKPDPASLQALMAKYGVPASETLLIGDSAVDIETGRRAGVLTAVVAHGFSSEADLIAAQPDLLVPDLKVLLETAHKREW